MTTQSSARKSDTFLHTTLSRVGTGSEQHQDHIRSHTRYRKASEDATNTDLLRERLSRMFDDGVRPKQRRSTDIVTTLNPKTRPVKADRSIDADIAPPDSPHRAGSISTHELPLKQVPNRRSSLVTSRQASLQDFPSWRLPPPDAAGKLIPNRGRAESPVKRSIAEDPISSDLLRASPSKTFVRPSPPLVLLQNGNVQSKRVDLAIDLKAPVFVGGGTIEGKVNIDIDRNHFDRTKKKELLISKLSIDVVGLELMGDGRKWVFLALASELFDEKHPPPPSITASQEPTAGPELFWRTKLGRASVPFHINLPLNIGPPPYASRHASIRYALVSTFVVKSGDKKTVLCQVCEIHMHTVYDPYKALASLPSPMVVSETMQLSKNPGSQSVKLSAGLHRQIWVSGSSIFVDIHIVNQIDRSLKKIEIELQRSLLWYDHAAAGTGERNANHLRIPKRQDSDIVSTMTIKKSKDWRGVLPATSEVRTCQLDVPRGQVTVSTGRFFEVRYFLNVTVTVAIFKTISVQLPVTLIHMNSLDIVPNALNQVAASIEAKRSKTLPLEAGHAIHLPYHQGQAFIAPQTRSFEQSRYLHEGNSGRMLDGFGTGSHRPPHGYQHPHHHCRNAHLSEQTNLPGRSSIASQKGHHRHDSDCYHCHLVHENVGRPSTSHSRTGGNLPRLHVSTSGLGFTDTEFSVKDSPPRKVMLSERERKMINQQRELEKRQEWSKVNRQGSKGPGGSTRRRPTALQPLPNTNVANRLNEQIKRAEPHVMERPVLNRKRSRTIEVTPGLPLQPRMSASLERMLEPPVKLNPSNANANLAVPRDMRRRANTGPDHSLKPGDNIGVDHLHKGVTFPQDTANLQRMSSKQRGKLPADGFVFPDERPGSRQHREKVEGALR